MANNKSKILTFLGFAQKAGKIVSGSSTVESMLGSKDAKLLIVAEDTSQSLVKQILNKCENLKQKYIIFGTKDELGMAIGKSQRAFIIIKDINIANAILETTKSTEEL